MSPVKRKRSDHPMLKDKSDLGNFSSGKTVHINIYQNLESMNKKSSINGETEKQIMTYTSFSQKINKTFVRQGYILYLL